MGPARKMLTSALEFTRSSSAGLNMGRRRIRIFLSTIILAVLGSWIGAPSALRAQGFGVRRVATGLSLPVYVTAPPADPTRIFVVEQHSGRIRIVHRNTWTLDPTPFLTINGVSTADEQGLLGLAFDPDYATNGFFYVNYTDPDTRIVRYTVSSNPDVANPASARPVLSITQPQANHNGGWLGFGPDGYLYIPTGDGGGGYDSGAGHTSGTGNAQDLTSNRLGKILRIDVDRDDFPTNAAENWGAPPDNPFVGVTGDDEIWAYGLRNPFRASFDRQTGDFYMGDVGQETCEEVNLLPASGPRGANFGWRLREGVIPTPGAGVEGSVGGPAPGAINPIFDFPHGGISARCSDPPANYWGNIVTGGYVYRGPIAPLRGRYFFADYFRGTFWSLVWDGSNPASFNGRNYSSLIDHGTDPAFAPDAGDVDNISSFGEDSNGNLYVVDHAEGEVFYLPEPDVDLALGTTLAATLVLTSWRRRHRFR